MRILGLGVVLLGAFLCFVFVRGAYVTFASDQTHTTNPGDDLLRAVKALAESGRTDDPATVAALLHVSFSGINHSVSGGNGLSGCVAGGGRVSDTYDAPGSGIGYYWVNRAFRCNTLSQNEVSADIEIFRGSDGDCITQSQVEAVFPKLGPGSSAVHGMGINGEWRADFSYSIPGATVDFAMTQAPPEILTVVGDLGIPPDMRPPPDLIASHHPPFCLWAMDLSSQSRIDFRHAPNFSYRPPTASRAGMISPSKSYSALPTDPGLFLLHSVKAVADSGRIDDPDIVANLLHTSLTPENYSDDIATSCSATPNFRNFAFIDYRLTDKTWFHSLPTGKQVLVGGFALVSGQGVVFTGIPIGLPFFIDRISGQITCKGSREDSVGGAVIFGGIPTYACITEPQIRSVFPSAQRAPAGDNWDVGADLRYSRRVSTIDGWTFEDAIVDFGMMSSRPGGLQPHQPNCLNEIDIHGLYHLGGVHKLDLGN